MTNRCIPGLLLLLALSMFACRVPEAPQAPPHTPTPQPAPTPDLSFAVLTLDDLPDGFAVVPPDQVWPPEDPTDDLGIHSTDFSFEHPEARQYLFGSTILFPTTLDAGAFDLILNRPTMLLDALASALNQTQILTQSELSLPEPIGDLSAAITLLVDTGEDTPLSRLDVVAFRRGLVGAIVFVWYTDGDTPLLPAQHAARTLDRRIAAVTSALQPPESPSPTPKTPPHVSLPQGYRLEVDQDLRLSFARPSSWPANRGSFQWPDSTATMTFVAYGTQSDLAADYKTIQLIAVDQPMGSSPEHLIEQVLDINEDKLRDQQADILERPQGVHIHAQPAAGIVYRATDPRGARFFSILLAVNLPDRAYVFNWASTIEHEDEMRTIYDEMLPTIRFIE